MPSEATGRTIPHACHAKRTLRARFPTPATQIHVRDTSGGHLSPHLPRETHPHQRPNARFPAPATRIHPPVPSRARTCIRSPTLATRSARPPCAHATRPDANPHGMEVMTTRRRADDDTATSPRRAGANDANTGPAPRPPDYEQEPFATHSGKTLNADQIGSAVSASGLFVEVRSSRKSPLYEKASCRLTTYHRT